MNAGHGRLRSPVENIYYGDHRKMPHGVYRLSVNQYTRRETIDVGFDVKIDILGTVHRFSYANTVKDYIQVAELHVTDSR